MESLPDSIIEEDQFFKSKAIKGIGPKTLRALRGIADEDGGTIADIFDTCSWKLRTVHGIGPNVSHNKGPRVTPMPVPGQNRARPIWLRA